ncbi:MAG: HEAT repeat domain-containing protein [Acidimicrobiales bacterium]
MISREILRLVLTIEVAAVLTCLAAVAIHAVWLWWRQRADAPRLTKGRATLAATVAAGRDGDSADDGVGQLRRLPRRVQRRVVEQLAVSVVGDEGRRVTGVAESLGLVAAAERRCASRWWWRRLLGAYQLNVYSHGQDWLPRLLDDPHPAVRAQALEWAGDAAREDLAPHLAAALRDPSPLCRHTAADSILRAGALLVDALAAELGRRPEDEQADLLSVLAQRPDPRYREAAMAATADVERPGRRAAGAALLGGIGGADAGSALTCLLADGDASVRVAAADALRRLGHVAAAPDVAPLLRDPVFAVRRAAGAALAALGPGGTLLLRHYLGDDNQFAADMARYSLDVAALRGTGGVG